MTICQTEEIKPSVMILTLDLDEIYTEEKQHSETT